MKIAIGGDHAGYHYKNKVLEHLEKEGFEIKDFGSYNEQSADYPDYVHPLAQDVESGKYDFGILICGSGNGVAMTANKYKGVRAALCWLKDLAEMARKHNNANIICLPSRYIRLDDALNITDAFLKTEFEGGRHERRVNKISNC